MTFTSLVQLAVTNQVTLICQSYIQKHAFYGMNKRINRPLFIYVANSETEMKTQVMVAKDKDIKALINTPR
jgi:hypothetical protein